MVLPQNNPTGTHAWEKLRAHFSDIQYAEMKDLFAQDPKRSEKMSMEWQSFFVDFSKNRINEKTLNLLVELAEEVELKKAINQYFSGDNINETENRAVLHTALRDFDSTEILVDGKNIIPDIRAVKNKIQKFTSQILNKELKGYTGKAFTDVVNIGIGGSDLGPAMVCEALKFYNQGLKMHFMSNIDGDHVQDILNNIDPETTLFVIVSKTFTTQETLSNATTSKQWFLKNATEDDIAKHFVAVSTNLADVTSFGINPDNIFPMWDWVGGRFSLWSAVGLSISLSVGYTNFEKLLKGAFDMDNHFKTAPFNENIPVVLALISVWYNNFFGAETEAIIAYNQYLQKLAPYLQQGIMESNGKNIGRDGYPVNYQTGTIIWGEPGTNSQHAFFQLIHQGTKLIPADFIGFKNSVYGHHDHHMKLMSNFFAQTEALFKGKTEEEVIAEFEAKGLSENDYKKLIPFKVFDGNKPTNTFLIDQLTPETLGSLLAIYEHKIFVQGIIWNIFSFDQWGVELGKQLANKIYPELQDDSEVTSHDVSTNNLINTYKKWRK
jgi:glucose-6-phosphate isomerase